MTQIITMTITRYIKFFYAWNKPKSKKKMRIKENKEKKYIKLKNKNYEDLGQQSSLFKGNGFKPSWRKNIFNRWKKNSDCYNVGDDPFIIRQKVLSFIRKSWAVEKEVIQCFNIKTKNALGLSASKKLCLNKEI